MWKTYLLFSNIQQQKITLQLTLHAYCAEYGAALPPWQWPWYYGAKHIRQNVPVIVKTMAVLADRPERCAITSILGHNGLTTKRWRYVGIIDQDNLPSCHKFFNNRINNICSYVYVTCHQCCDWNYNANNQRIRQPLQENILHVNTRIALNHHVDDIF